VAIVTPKELCNSGRLSASSRPWRARFEPGDYVITFHDEKLAAHSISRYDVMEVLANGFRVIRNKRKADRYRLMGRTDAGRALELIVVLEGSSELRFITGWDL
jgi:hypothetical protein